MPAKSQKLSSEYILAIRNYMAKFNLTQKELAERAGMGKSTLQFLFRNKQASNRTLERLRRVGIVDPALGENELPDTLEINGTVYKKID